MLTITLQGAEAEDYLTYRRTSAMLTQEPAPVITPAPATVITTPAPAIPKLHSTTVTRAFDNNWRAQVETGVTPVRANRERWTDRELDVLVNAANKLDKTYYSVTAIAVTLGRSKASIVAAASRLGFFAANDMLTPAPNQKENKYGR